MELTLPFAERNSDGTKLGYGIASFDNGNGSKTVPVPQDGAGVAAHTIISSAAAPTVYEYSISAGLGTVLQTIEGGSVLVVDSAGAHLGAVAPPWARDAAGAEVKTHYEVEGTILRQVVDHVSTDVKYPLVAEAYAGAEYFGSTWWTGSGSTLVAHLNTTPLVAAAFATGYPYVLTWPEAKAKMGYRIEWENLRQQFSCHANGAPFASSGGSPSWDLENHRGTTWNYNHYWIHGCNW